MVRWAPRPVDDEPFGAGRAAQDVREDAHLFGDVHRRPEQVDGVAARLSQRGCPFDDRDVEAVRVSQ